MASVGSVSSTVLWLSSASRSQNANHRICFLSGNQNHSKALSFSTLCTSHVPLPQNNGLWSSIDFSLKAASSSSSVDNVEYIEEPATKVRFQRLLSLPGRSTSLSLVGTGYREKVFAIIGVKVYAAGLYINESIFSLLHAWKERSAADLKWDSSLFDTIFQAPSEKSLHIVLVRDVDGKTFWDALNDAISPRIKSRTPVDEDALSTFANIFLGRPLNKGTSIFMIWLDSTNMLVSVSSEGMPLDVGTKIESSNVTAALFDVFLGGEPVSPALKESVANGLAAVLK